MAYINEESLLSDALLHCLNSIFQAVSFSMSSPDQYNVANLVPAEVLARFALKQVGRPVTVTKDGYVWADVPSDGAS